MDEPPKSSILSVDDTFASYQELQDAINRYEIANRVQFWKRDAKRMQRASPRVYEIIKNYPQLEYCSIRFTCIHGGQHFRPKNILGIRKSRGTWKQDCKAEILVGLNEDKNRLIVKKIVNEHNHEIPTKEMYKQFPKNRRRKIPSPKSQNILENLVRANSLARSNNLKRIAMVLTENYKCTVDLQSDEEEKVFGFFFQDNHMRTYFDKFPEMLLMDGTYKLLNIGCCIYILSSENSVGTTDVVGVAVLTVEDKTSVEWMIDRFKERNPKWESTAIVVTDRLTSEYKIASKYFPSAKRLICLSHALSCFKRDTLPCKLSVTPTESDSCFDFFNKLIEASSEEEYRAILEDMEDNIPYPLMQYFFNSWHDLKSEWVKGLGASIRTYVNSKFDSKLKSTIANCKTFSKFIENLFLVLGERRKELIYEFNRMITKVPACDEYAKYLTPYANQKIDLSQKEISQVTYHCNEDSDVICETTDNTFVVSEISCNCDFFTLMKLPCKHLLMYRKLQGMSLFDEYLFSQRWTRKYLQDMFREFEVGTKSPNKTVGEKFGEAQSVCLALAGLASKFDKRIHLLGEVREHWQSGNEVAVHKVCEQKDVFKIDHDYVGETMEVE